MDLFDVKARGFGQPLNSREISHLVRSGCINRSTRCKPRGESRWQRIDALFPLLDYGVGSYELPPGGSPVVRHRVALALACLLVAALIAGGAFSYWNRSSTESSNTVPGKAPPSPASAPVVLARN